MPTRCPSASNAAARLTVSDVLPTPPLPEAIASTRVERSSEIPFVRSVTEPRSFSVSTAFSSCESTSKESETERTPGRDATCSLTWSWKLVRSGQPTTVRAIVTETSGPSSEISRTIPRSTTLRFNSGSITRSSAFRTASRFGSIANEPSNGEDTAVTWAELVWRNLLRRRVRTMLTAAGVAIGVGLIVALLSLTTGAKRTAGQLIHIGRADFGLFQRGVFDLTQSRLPDGLAARVDRERG